MNKRPNDSAFARVVLVGNPNVGKSTLFNALTGMHQHTGNWPGKTVSGAQGVWKGENASYLLIDTPGTYSLLSQSPEEEVTRDQLYFGDHAAVVVVCDATCLARNLYLLLQVLELTDRVVLCVNLMDEARKKQISIDLAALEKKLGIPVVGVSARKKSTLAPLARALERLGEGKALVPSYSQEIEDSIQQQLSFVEQVSGEKEARRLRFLALRRATGQMWPALTEKNSVLAGMEGVSAVDPTAVASSLMRQAGDIAAQCSQQKTETHSREDRLDRVLTGKYTAFPVMLILLAGIFWLTVVGANYPSALLLRGFAYGEQWLSDLFDWLGMSAFWQGLLLDGVYHTLSLVVSVMLPPMAIFFPLFTLLEDSGYLPRIAYALDPPFRCSHACGKQALCMCMGLGCNAVGVTGCRIITSPRERLLAILTNSMIPCNGRFPAMISLFTLFFVGSHGGLLSSVGTAAMLVGVLVLGVLATLLATKFLAVTLFRGMPSSFVLELPPYRMPQIGHVIIRSLLDRTLFVLGRAVAVAAPAGAVIWLLAHIQVGQVSLLLQVASFLAPLGRGMGLDGVILLAFLLGLPANEIVLPVALMLYTASGSLAQAEGVGALGAVLAANGWSAQTAVCFVMFSLLHFPCSTTLWTVRKEAGSWRYCLLSALLPTVMGMVLCFALHLIFA